MGKPCRTPGCTYVARERWGGICGYCNGTRKHRQKVPCPPYPPPPPRIEFPVEAAPSPRPATFNYNPKPYIPWMSGLDQAEIDYVLLRHKRRLATAPQPT